MKPDIILTTKLFPPTQAILEREYTCHRLYEAKDRNAFLQQLAPKVRALAPSSGSRIDANLMDALPRLEIISPPPCSMRTAMGNLQIENLRLYFAGKDIKTRVA